MTKNRYLMLVVLTLITITSGALTQNAAGKLRQFQLYFASNRTEFTATISQFESRLISSLLWDTLFLVGYGLLFLTIGWFQRTQGRFGYITMVFGGLGAVLDLLENQKLVQLALESLEQQVIDLNTMHEMQALCVAKFLCTAIAISSAAMFFAGKDGLKVATRVILWLGALGLTVGCLMFVVSQTLHVDLNVWAGHVEQIGLQIAFFGLLGSTYEYVREWRNSSLRPF